MRRDARNWILGLIYIIAVATIWIAASFVVQSVVDAGVSPFLITYICNSLFVIYIPIVEVARYFEDFSGNLCLWNGKNISLQVVAEREEDVLLRKSELRKPISSLDVPSIEPEEITQLDVEANQDPTLPLDRRLNEDESSYRNMQLDSKGRWTRTRVAKVSLLICPFWFLAQLSFNLSLKYTTVTSNTILSTASSLFTFLFSLAFLGEKFTLLKLASVLLCMGGTVIVSLGDSKTSSSTLSAINSNPVLGDILALMSSGFYAVYITLIRKKLPNDDGESGKVSMAQFLGFLGLFNFIIFLPVAMVLNFSKLESLYTLTWKQLGLVVGKGLLDNVLSDYLWAKAVLLTTTTVATAGLTIQVPLAAVVDTITGNAPHSTDYIGAAAVMIGFVGINIPCDTFAQAKEAIVNLGNEEINTREHVASVCKDATQDS